MISKNIKILLDQIIIYWLIYDYGSSIKFINFTLKKINKIIINNNLNINSIYCIIRYKLEQIKIFYKSYKSMKVNKLIIELENILHDKGYSEKIKNSKKKLKIKYQTNLRSINEIIY